MQPNLTSIKPPEVSKSYTIVGVSILSHIHPGAEVENKTVYTNAYQAHNNESKTLNKSLFLNVFWQTEWLSKRR